jgi:acyl carrier protein
MTISSRTPEGVPGQCPICEKLICVEPSLTTGDAPCPRCGTLLWFVVVEAAARFYPQGDISPRKKQLIERLANAAQDSLDFAEFVMELEEEFGTEWHVPDAKIQEMRSVGDLIDYIIRELPE